VRRLPPLRFLIDARGWIGITRTSDAGRGRLEDADVGRPNENQFAVAEDGLVVLYGRFSGINPEAMVTVNVVRVEDGRLAEHWDVWEKEATRAESVSAPPMFGDSFPDEK
jgi:hypothetical protein